VDVTHYLAQSVAVFAVTARTTSS